MIGTVLCIYETSCDKLDNELISIINKKYSCYRKEML